MDENKLYSAIENAVIKWTIDGTKTAGSLTREIMSLVEKSKPAVHHHHHHVKIKDEWGNTDWRDTGEMGG